MIALRIHEDLGLVLEAPEGFGVEDPVAVSLEAGSPRIGLLRDGASNGIRRQGGAGRKDLPFLDLRHQTVTEHEPGHS